MESRTQQQPVEMVPTVPRDTAAQEWSQE